MLIFFITASVPKSLSSVNRRLTIFVKRINIIATCLSEVEILCWISIARLFPKCFLVNIKPICNEIKGRKKYIVFYPSQSHKRYPKPAENEGWKKMSAYNFASSTFIYWVFVSMEHVTLKYCSFRDDTIRLLSKPLDKRDAAWRKQRQKSLNSRDFRIIIET